MRITPLARIRLAHSFISIVRDPKNLDDVLDLSDTIASGENAAEILAAMEPEVQQAAHDAPNWGPLPPLEALRALPDGSLGREYARFMDDNGLTPEALREVSDAGDELSQFRAGVRRSHDVWHVASGWTPDLLGELGLQAFYLAQLRVPFPAFVLAAGLLHTVLKRREHFYDVLDAVAEGWRQGSEARALVGVDWAQWMEQPVDEVRERLAISPARRRPQPVIPLVA